MKTSKNVLVSNFGIQNISRCLPLGEQIVITHITYEIRFWGGVQVWINIGYLLQLVYTTPSRFSWVKHISSIRMTHTQKNVDKIFVSQICIFYKNDSHTKQNPEVCWQYQWYWPPGTFLMSQGVFRDFQGVWLAWEYALLRESRDSRECLKTK